MTSSNVNPVAVEPTRAPLMNRGTTSVVPTWTTSASVVLLDSGPQVGSGALYPAAAVYPSGTLYPGGS